jgi:uncharacterized protein YgiM (DUF1202 family)
MSRLVVFLILPLFVPAFSHAQTPRLPFEATITVNDTYVRSGPGKRFYPTGKLHKGARVTIRRKDLGGWYMIDPPPGSFSWIRAEYVDRTGSGRTGILNAKSVVVRVGSQFGNTRDVEQRRLSTGDEVDILDEATLDTNGVAIRMYKISPPRGEYRWIAGRSVVAADDAIRSLHDRDPYRIPSQVQREKPNSQPNTDSGAQPIASERLFSDAEDVGATNRSVEQRPLVRSRDDRVQQTESSSDNLQADQSQLRELDNQFRKMIGSDTATWNLAELERGYRELRNQTDSLAVQQQIELRFPALEKYKNIKTEYEKLVTLTNETHKRDAQLLTMQAEINPGTDTQSSATQSSATQSTATQSSDNGGQVRPQPPTSPTEPQAKPVPTTRRFVGAGIVQINRFPQQNVPRHVLITPTGRLLAYLQVERGVNLNQYVGRAVGLDGRRWYRADLRADNILVRDVTPVRLRQK